MTNDVGLEHKKVVLLQCSVLIAVQLERKEGAGKQKKHGCDGDIEQKRKTYSGYVHIFM
jgi:hypothetical protein